MPQEKVLVLGTICVLSVYPRICSISTAASYTVSSNKDLIYNLDFFYMI